MLHKAWSSIEEVPYCFWRSSVKFQGHSAKKNRRFWPKLGVSRLKNQFESNLSKITRPVAAIKSLRFALFGFWMAWFWQRNSSLLWNFSFKFHVHVLCGCKQKLNDCQLCRFQNGCLVILNNVQLQSTHCPLPPSPIGRRYPSRSLICNF